MSFPAYPSYQESGVEWLGPVPRHWTVTGLKRAFSIAGGSTPKSDVEDFWHGDIPWITPGDLSKLSTKFISETARMITDSGLASCAASLSPAGSIVVSTRAPIGSLAVTKIDASTNQGCKTLISKDNANAAFGFYTLSVATEQLNVRGKGSTFLEISADDLGSFVLPFPPLSEQVAIAAFLDRETAKIDALIEEQRRLIALLKEKRQAVISHAVTKGLDPHTPMKDSGIEWLGQVPAHWEVCKLGFHAKLQSGYAFSSSAFGTEGVPVVRMTNLARGKLDLSNAIFVPEQVVQDRVSLIEGDLVWGMSGSIGETGSLGNFARVAAADLPCQLNQRVGRFVCLGSMSTDHLEFMIQSEAFQKQTILFVTGTAQFNVSGEQVQSILVAIPPLVEQADISAFLRDTLARHAELVIEAERSIDLFNERRAALISAAVTGKIDVRGVVLREDREAA